MPQYSIYLSDVCSTPVDTKFTKDTKKNPVKSRKNLNNSRISDDQNSISNDLSKILNSSHSRHQRKPVQNVQLLNSWLNNDRNERNNDSGQNQNISSDKESIKINAPKQGFPLTPINEAYLELYHQNGLAKYSGKNLNDLIFDHEPQVNISRNIEPLECDEELEIEQAREEIASLESDQIEPQIPKNHKVFEYQKKLEDFKDPKAFENNSVNDFDETLFKTFYKNFKPDTTLNLSPSNDASDTPGFEQQIDKNMNFINQVNPITKTFFKCSIYSPSYRLYTVDEVNSTMSENEMSSQFRFSAKNQDSVNMT